MKARAAVCLFCLILAGCSGASKTRIDPARSEVNEKLDVTQPSRFTDESVRLRITLPQEDEEEPCAAQPPLP